MPVNKNLVNKIVEKKQKAKGREVEPFVLFQINGNGEVQVFSHYNNPGEISNLAVMVLGLLNNNLDEILVTSLPEEIMEEVDRLHEEFHSVEDEAMERELNSPVVSPYETLEARNFNHMESGDD